MNILRYAFVGNVKGFLENIKKTAKKENKSAFIIFNKFL